MRLSPSRIVTTRRGTPRRWSTAVAATASGGATIAPSVSATGQAMSGISTCATAATMTVVNSTRPMASNRIGRAFALKSRMGVKYAAANRIGGRKSRKTRSGSSVMRGIAGSSPRTTPPNRRRIGSATLNRRARYDRAVATTRRTKTASMGPIGAIIRVSGQAWRRGGGSAASGGHAGAIGRGLSAADLERGKVVGRREAEDRAEEREPVLDRPSNRLGPPETVALTRERDVSVLDASVSEGRDDRLGLGRRHDPVVETVQHEDRAGDAVEMPDR